MVEYWIYLIFIAFIRAYSNFYILGALEMAYVHKEPLEKLQS